MTDILGFLGASFYATVRFFYLFFSFSDYLKNGGLLKTRVDLAYLKGGYMIFLIEAKHPLFDEKPARALFLKHQDDLDDRFGFDFLKEHALFFNVYNRFDGAFVGCVFAFNESGRTYVGGYAVRHRHKECVAALKRVCSLFPCVYAKTRHLTAKICLKRAGFERVPGDKRLWKCVRGQGACNTTCPVFLNG